VKTFTVHLDIPIQVQCDHPDASMRTAEHAAAHCFTFYGREIVVMAKGLGKVTARQVGEDTVLSLIEHAPFPQKA
jgi:hypothetical protein